MYYHNCVIHLYRPFVKVSFVQNIKAPRQICTDEANMITRLMNQYFDIYGSKYSIFMMSHCIVSAGIIHLVNLSSSSVAVSPSVREQAEISLIHSMRCLVAPQITFPLVERFLGTLITLTHKWFTNIPPRIQETLTQVGGVSHSRIAKNYMGDRPHESSWTASSTDNHNFVRPPRPSSSGPSNQSANLSFHSASRKHSVTGLVQMAPPSTQAPPLYPNHAPHPQLTSPNTSHPPQSQYSQQLYWTPFPENFGGVPLPLLDHSNQMAQQQMSPANTMSVTGMLGGEFPTLTQDGFMLESEYQAPQHPQQQRTGSVGHAGQTNGGWSAWNRSMNGT